MNKEDILIFGTSKVAEIVYSSIIDDKECKLNPVAFCVDSEYWNEKEKFGLPVVSFSDVEKKYESSKFKMFIAIGYHKMNQVRAMKCAQAEEKGYQLVSFIHSKADVPDNVKIGKNTVILNNVSVGPFSTIGNNVCIYNNATVSHHVTVGDNVWMTSGSVIGGNSEVGNNCFLGINSTIAHNIHIGDNNFIGTKAVITKNTDNDSVYIVPDTPKYRLNTEQFMRMFKFD